MYLSSDLRIQGEATPSTPTLTAERRARSEQPRPCAPRPELWAPAWRVPPRAPRPRAPNAAPAPPCRLLPRPPAPSPPSPPRPRAPSAPAASDPARPPLKSTPRSGGGRTVLRPGSEPWPGVRRPPRRAARASGAGTVASPSGERRAPAPGGSPADGMKEVEPGRGDASPPSRCPQDPGPVPSTGRYGPRCGARSKVRQDCRSHPGPAPLNAGQG